jgi:hypothetical protein
MRWLKWTGGVCLTLLVALMAAAIIADRITGPVAPLPPEAIAVPPPARKVAPAPPPAGAASLPAGVRACASKLDAFKGRGFTPEAAEDLERTCQAAMTGAPDVCSAFLTAAGRAGFKAAAGMIEWTNVALGQYRDARADAAANRATCGV